MPMGWNCAQTEERLSDYLDGALRADEAAAFSAHAAGCANCTQTIAQVGSLVSRMQRIAPVQEPANLAGRILDETLGPRRASKRNATKWFGWAPKVWEP